MVTEGESDGDYLLIMTVETRLRPRGASTLLHYHIPGHGRTSTRHHHRGSCLLFRAPGIRVDGGPPAAPAAPAGKNLKRFVGIRIAPRRPALVPLFLLLIL